MNSPALYSNTHFVQKKPRLSNERRGFCRFIGLFGFGRGDSAQFRLFAAAVRFIHIANLRLGGLILVVLFGHNGRFGLFRLLGRLGSGFLGRLGGGAG